MYQILITLLLFSVPPSGVQVSDDWAPVKNGITIAYAEGASLTLTCVASFGKPLARVSALFKLYL